MIRFFVNHPTAANIFMLAFLALGVVALGDLRRETFPRIQPTEVQVQIAYPGAVPEDVDRAICRPAEDAVSGIQNLIETRCEARENVAVLTVEMAQDEDFEQFFEDVQTEISAVTSFPDTAEEPVIAKLGRVEFVASVAVTGGHDRVALKDLADDLKDLMLRRGDIPLVAVSGFSDRQIRIEIADTTARAMGLTLAGIADVVARQNVDVPAGEIVSRGGTTLLRFADQRRALDSYRDIVVRATPAGAEVRLGDIAEIRTAFEDAEVKTLLDGRPAALLDVSKSATDDTLRVREAVAEFIDQVGPTLPPTVELTVIRDGSTILRDRLSMLITNAAQGLALVAGVVWLFFGPRQAFWIAMGLPVSFLGALAVVPAIGYSINMMTLVGLLIVIGILMDDAIVIAEKIASKREEGLSPVEAAIAGPREVAGGVLSSFATTVVIFGSLAFLEGTIGEVLRVIPVIMGLVLTISLIEAFLILPHHLAHAGGNDAPTRINRWVDRQIESARVRGVRPVVRAAVAQRYLTLGIAVALLMSAFAVMAAGWVKFTAFPDIEGDRVEARIELSASATLGQTEEMVAEVRAALSRTEAALGERTPGGQPLVQKVTERFSQNVDAGTTGAHLATVEVDLLESAGRGVRLEAFITHWRAEIPPSPLIARINVTEPGIGPAGRDIHLRLSGPDLDVLAAASADLQDWLRGYAGTYNITDDLTAGKPELKISLAEGAGATGLDATAVARQVRAVFQGVTADEVQIGDETVEIELRGVLEDRGGLAAIERFTVQTPGGMRVPLGTVARIEAGRGYSRITRIDRQPTVSVTGNVDPGRGNANEIVTETLTRIVPEIEAAHPGVSVGVEGMNAEAAKTQRSMITSVALGLIAVFLLLSFQLRSYAEPLVIMVIIPFALIGAIWGHLALGLDMTLPSMLGLVSLAGIVVNDSILLVNHIKRAHEEDGLPIAEAAPEGAAARFRAILLTSLTTIAGVAPLLVETSLQAQVLVPLVASIAFGLAATTLLLVVVVPAFYCILDDLGMTEPARRRRRRGPDGDTVPPARGDDRATPHARRR